jgi:hypothetical protein
MDKPQNKKHVQLRDYRTGEYIREATDNEARESWAASQRDGGAGVIKVGERSCYVVEL